MAEDVIATYGSKSHESWIDSGVLRAVKHQRFVRVLRADFARRAPADAG